MDIKSYIDSGILADYVLGAVTDQERREVECLSKIYPEIKAEVSLIQEAIERMALKSVKTPSPALKKKVLEAIKRTKQESYTSEKETKVVSLDQNLNQSGRTKIIAAASIILLIGVSAYTYFLQQDIGVIESKFVSAQVANDSLKNQVAFLEDEAGLVQEHTFNLEQQIAFIGDKNTKKIQLNGTPNFPDHLAAVYWNSTNQKTLLLPDKLPALTEDQSYQLWVLIEGTPSDMGIVELDSKTGLVEMKQTENADAFAITIEPKGGSDIPTLENLCVIGNV